MAAAVPAAATFLLVPKLHLETRGHSSANAQLLNFDFSFYGSSGSDIGTVSGELIGLQNNATSLPTDVILTLAPSGIVATTPTDFAPFFASGGGFTVTSGVVTAAGAEIISSENNYTLYFNDASNQLYNNNTGHAAFNENGFLGATYAEVVPEPSTWAMLLGGLGLLAFWRLRTRRI